MRARALMAATAAAVALPAPAAAGAAAPRVEVLVQGRSATLQAPDTVTARAATVRVGRARCAVAAGTPLAALEAVRGAGGPAYRLRDFGACSRRAADAGQIYVSRIGPDAARGSEGWVYKVGNRVGTAGAGDPTGPFGRGRLRPGQRVLWFWCRQSAEEQCQRTLGVRAPARTAAGAPVAVRVVAYDDDGRGVPAAGARVAAGDATATAGPDGVATLPGLPAGEYTVAASLEGAVAGFPEELRVG